MYNKLVWWLSCLAAVILWASLPVGLALLENYTTLNLGVAVILVSSLASMTFSLGALISVHVGWTALNQLSNEDEDVPFGQSLGNTISATQAVAYLFIPVFNVYWQFVAFAGWSIRARVQERKQDRVPTAPSAAVAVFAIVSSVFAGVLIVILPPFGVALGVASTVAWLIVMDAMLNYSNAKHELLLHRGMAYFTIVRGQLDWRLAAGSVAVLVVAGLLSTTINLLLRPSIYEWIEPVSPDLLVQLARSFVYIGMLAVMVVMLPALTGAKAAVRNPWLLVPLLVPACLVASAVSVGVVYVWQGDHPPVLTSSVLFGYSAVFRTTSIAAVLLLLASIRRAGLAIFAGLAVVEIIALPLQNVLDLGMHRLLSDDSYSNWSLIAYPLIHMDHYTGILVLKAALIAGGLTALHRACRSPLVVPTET